MIMLRFRKKRLLVDVKAKYLLFDIGLLQREDRVGEPDSLSMRLGDDSDCLGVGLKAFPFCESGGSRSQFPGLMDALHMILILPES